jgi:hypothetical protein
VVDVTGRIVNDNQPETISLVWERDATELQDWQCPAQGRRSFHWSGRQVFNAGSQITFACPGTTPEGAHCDASITAYQLALP